MLGAVYQKKKTRQPLAGPEPSQLAKAWPPNSIPVNTTPLSHVISVLSHSYINQQLQGLALFSQRHRLGPFYICFYTHQYA